MKKFALVRLENGRNLVMEDFEALHLIDAVNHFRSTFMPLLDDDGYHKTTYGVTFCVAEYYQPHYG